METILDHVKPSDIRREPFRYVKVDGAISEALAAELLQTYPSLEQLCSGSQGLARDGKVPNNLKIRYGSQDIARDPAVTDQWKAFVQAHLTYDFFRKYLDLFGEELCIMHPQLKELFADLKEGDVGVRGVDSFADKKILLEAEICADSPVTKPSSARTAHIDDPYKLGVALLYLKPQTAKPVGGDFEVFKPIKNKFVINHIRNVKKPYLQNLELVERVSYEHNRLVLFLNSKDAFHGVGQRLPTDQLRYVFNVAFNVEKPLFDLTEYRESKLVSRLRSYFLYVTGLHKEQV